MVQVKSLDISKRYGGLTMAVIPSFSSYAPAPDLAGAFLGRERIAQQAASDAARIQLGYAQLEQEAVNNEMELAARMETNTRNALMKAQENEIEKAYRDTQIGIAQKNLQQEELATQMKLAEAASAFDRQQAYTRGFEAKRSAGLDPAQAAQQTMLEVGFGQPGFAGALTPSQPQSQMPVANFEYRRLQGLIDDKMRPYSGDFALPVPPELQAEVDTLRSQQANILPGIGISIPSAGGSTNAAPKVRRYNRSTGRFE